MRTYWRKGEVQLAGGPEEVTDERRTRLQSYLRSAARSYGLEFNTLSDRDRLEYQFALNLACAREALWYFQAGERGKRTRKDQAFFDNLTKSIERCNRELRVFVKDARIGEKGGIPSAAPEKKADGIKGEADKFYNAEATEEAEEAEEDDQDFHISL